MSVADAGWLSLDGSRFEGRPFVAAWILAAVAYGAGDVVTTMAVVYAAPSLLEANPAVRVAIATFGGGGYLALKLLVFYTSLGISLYAGKPVDDPLLFYGPPLLLCGVGVWTTAHNAVLLL